MVTTARVAAEHGSFNRISQVAPICCFHYVVAWAHAAGLPLRQRLDRFSRFCRIRDCAKAQTHRPRNVRRL